MAQVRAPMPASRRAKQFSMFDALKGLKEALAAKERQPEPRIELAQDAIEELNRTLCTLKPGTIVTVVYYCRYREAYCQITGSVKKVDMFWKILQIGSVCIDFDDTAEITLLYQLLCSRILKGKCFTSSFYERKVKITLF